MSLRSTQRSARNKKLRAKAFVLEHYPEAKVLPSRRIQLSDRFHLGGRAWHYRSWKHASECIKGPVKQKLLNIRLITADEYYDNAESWEELAELWVNREVLLSLKETKG